MSNVIHVCWSEVRSFRSHRYVGGTRIASWDNQLAKTHAVALVGGTAECETVCGKTIEGEVVVDKITMSAFEGTFLDLAMRDAGIHSFLIVGIALEIGIEPTVRQALDLNYLPVVITDACGSRTEELKHRSLATLAETGEVFTASTADILELLNKR